MLVFVVALVKEESSVISVALPTNTIHPSSGFQPISAKPHRWLKR